MKLSVKLVGAGLITLLGTGYAKADTPSVHGMVLFGKNKTYISHLPMFHAPHDYQAVFQVELSALQNNDAAVQEYMSSINSPSEQELFTLVPEKLDLSEVIAQNIKGFEATLYKGHFEKDGVELGKLNVKISKVILAKKLDARSVNTSKFTFFGGPVEYYAVKNIDGVGSYDAIVRAESPQGRKYRCTRADTVCDFRWFSFHKPDANLQVSDWRFATEAPTVGNIVSDIGPRVEPTFRFTVGEVIYASKEDLSH